MNILALLPYLMSRSAGHATEHDDPIVSGAGRYQTLAHRYEG